MTEATGIAIGLLLCVSVVALWAIRMTVRRSRADDTGRVARYRRPVEASSRREALAWLETLSRRGNSLFLDTECTGMGHADEVIEIGVIDGAGDVVFHSLVRPEVPISAGALAVHGIPDTDLTAAPTLAHLMPQLRRLLANHDVLAWNAAFDARLLAQSCDRHGIEHPVIRFVCALCLYQRALGRVGLDGRPELTSLSAAARQLGVLPTAGQQHRALDDCRLLRAVVIAMSGRIAAQRPG